MLNSFLCFVMGVFFVWVVLISHSLTQVLGERKSVKPAMDDDDDIMVAINQRQLDSLLINAIEGRLGEVQVDDELRDLLADDFITIAISYGDGRVRQATKPHY